MEYVVADLESFIISKFSSAYIGDDGAVIDGYCYSMDSFFEDVHFKKEWMSMKQIGRKSMLVNISDAIAMNAKPLFALISLSVPNDISTKEIEDLSTSMQQCAKEFGCEIIGGDTISGDKLSITVAIISKNNNPLFRKGLKEGCILAYTGTLGESKRDLELLFAGNKIRSNSRFYEPVLRGDFVERSREFLACGMDISDGLFCDTNKMLDMNDCGLELTLNISSEIGESGEEYEMLIGFEAKNINTIIDIASSCNTTITPFGIAKNNDFRFMCKNHHF
jgi:thiamine-monophosphate kinase